MYGYFGDFGDFGFYGDAVSDVEALIEKKKAEIKDLTKKIWGAKLFSAKRRTLFRRKKVAKVELKRLEAILKMAKKGMPVGALIATVKAKAPAKVGAAPKAPPKTSTLSPGQIEALRNMVRTRINMGVEENAAEEQVRNIALTPQQRAYYPKGFFIPLDRRGPRPVGLVGRSIDPRVMQRGIDPRLIQRGIDPRIMQRPIDPLVPQMGIDPMVPVAPVDIASGSFQFPPGNVADEEEMEEMEEMDEDTDLSGIVDDIGGFLKQPLVLGGLALAAIIYGPKLLKGKKAHRKNPRRKHRKNRRHSRRR